MEHLEKKARTYHFCFRTNSFAPCLIGWIKPVRAKCYTNRLFWGFYLVLLLIFQLSSRRQANRAHHVHSTKTRQKRRYARSRCRDVIISSARHLCVQVTMQIVQTSTYCFCHDRAPLKVAPTRQTGSTTLCPFFYATMGDQVPVMRRV